MRFMEYWHKFQDETGARGCAEMQLAYYQWLFESEKISLEERNSCFDQVYEKHHY